MDPRSPMFTVQLKSKHWWDEKTKLIQVNIVTKSH